MPKKLFSRTNEYDPGKRHCALIISDIEIISAQLVKNFAPVIDQQIHQDMLSPLSKKLLSLHTSFFADGHHDYGNILDAMKQTAENFKNWDTLFDKTQKHQKYFGNHIQWDHSRETYLAKKFLKTLILNPAHQR